MPKLTNNTTTFTPTSGDPWYTNNITTSGWHISWSQRHVDVVQNSSDTEFWTKERYRYGFNGMERDDEMKGFGNSYTAAFWEYDARLGRRWNVDPLAHKFPHQSPYLAMDGNPMLMKDPKGMSASKYGDEVGNNSGAVKDLNDATIYTSNYYRDALFAPIYTGGFIVPDILGIEYDRQYEPWETGCFLTMSLTDGDPVPKRTNPSSKKPRSGSGQGGGRTWDPVTDQRISQLDFRLQGPATNFIKAAQAQGINLRITQGYRTFAEQDALYAQGRTTPGKIVTNARGGESYHNYGLAFDVVIMKNGQPVWDRLPSNIGSLGTQYGFEWGGEWRNFPDYPHFQMTFGQSILQLQKSNDANE